MPIFKFRTFFFWGELLISSVKFLSDYWNDIIEHDLVWCKGYPWRWFGPTCDHDVLNLVWSWLGQLFNQHHYIRWARSCTKFDHSMTRAGLFSMLLEDLASNLSTTCCWCSCLVFKSCRRICMDPLYYYNMFTLVLMAVKLIYWWQHRCRQHVHNYTHLNCCLHTKFFIIF